VIGPSGAGKTTLLQVLACALPPGAGSITLDDIAPWQLPRRALQRLRGRLFLAPQVPPLPPRQRVVTAVLAGALPAMGWWASLRSLLYPGDIPGALAALQRFDLGDKLFDRVDRLSGGERQRVGLARALLAPAELWLIDEPLSALDPTRSRQALATLIGAARERGITLVASLHQVDIALAQFPRIVGLRDGRLAFDLPAAQVTPERLARLYAQHEHELQHLAPVPADAVFLSSSPPPPPPVAMHCR
jgi:phosphonate transport system ATP-binding protein